MAPPPPPPPPEPFAGPGGAAGSGVARRAGALCVARFTVPRTSYARACPPPVSQIHSAEIEPRVSRVGVRLLHVKRARVETHAATFAVRDWILPVSNIAFPLLGVWPLGRILVVILCFAYN